jgi:hypothetical protein
MGDRHLQFRLTYEGPLLSETSSGEKFAGRARNKQDIRKGVVILPKPKPPGYAK